MGRRAAYQVRLEDGREIGFGLVIRDEVGTYSVQFRDIIGSKYIIRSTGQTARPRALATAERMIREHYGPPVEGPAAAGASWDELTEELRKIMVADGLRDTTVKDYIDTLNQVRSAAVAPAALSAGLAQQWANAYLTTPFTRKHGEGAKQYFRSPQTLHARVRKLNAIWSQYVVRRMRAAKENPWETVDLPKLDRLPVRTLSANQVVNFFDWLTDRWKGWELPRLFFETKAVCGSRLMDLCSVRSSDLADGKIFFAQGTAKARKARIAVLPPDLFASLRKIAGSVWLWESYASEMPKYLALRGVPTHRVNPVFEPERLNWWAKDEVDDFNKAHPGAPKIQSHDFRKRAITEAHRAGLDLDTAAAGVGMSTTTARTYYLALEQEKAATEVATKLGHILRPPPTA